MHLYRRVHVLASAAAMTGAAVVYAWLQSLPVPRPDARESFSRGSLTLLVLYFAAAVPLAAWRTWQFYRPLADVYAERRQPTAEDQQALLRLPERHAVHNFGHWTAAAALFTGAGLAAGETRQMALRTAIAILLGGLSSSAVIYLLVEWGHRDVVADFLKGRAVRQPTVLGISQRMLVSWLLGSGVCLVAVLTAPLHLGREDRADVIPVMVTAALLGLVGGALLVWVTARSVAGRLRLVAAALHTVEQGDLDAEVPVDDGGELGQLQGSFNRMVAGLRTLTTVNARLNEEVQAQLAEVRASRRRIVAAGDEARRRVERDLHDGAQQRMVTLGLSLRMAHRRAQDLGDTDLVNTLDAAHRELQQAMRELRDLATGLHPTLLTEAGLAAAVTEAAARCPIPTTVTEVPQSRLPNLLEVAAYYTVTEGLTNAVKHAAADHIRVSVLLEEDELIVGVVDDGIGGAVLGRGSGLIGLHDRVASFGGTLTLHSPPGHGTTLWANFPISAAGEFAAAPQQARVAVTDL